MNYLKPVLDFIKAQIFLVVCAGVVLVSLVVLYFYFMPMDAATSESMNARYKEKGALESYGQATLDSPGVVYLDNNGQRGSAKGVLIPEITELKKRASVEMENQKKAIDASAAAGNTRNRLGPRGLPLFAGKEMDGYLPTHRTNVNLHIFRDEIYRNVFQNWAKELTGGSDGTAGVIQPRSELEQSFKAAVAARLAALPQQLRPAAGTEGAVAAREMQDFVKQHLVAQSLGVAMYVNPDVSFQHRDYVNKNQEPSDSQIFESFVDCWLIDDVVKAIKALNGDSRRVDTSRVKNLLGAAVGQNAKTTFGQIAGNAGGGGAGGALFEGFLGAAGALPAAPGRGVVATPGAAAGVDLTRSMTGRVGNESYDVVMLHVTIVCTPETVNQFIDEMYKRNNGYTLVNRREASVDPYEAASRGLMYGKQQCVQADLLFEALFFKDWASKLVPPNFTGGGGVVQPGNMGGGMGPGGGEIME